jgi:hypothetical protein
MPLTEEEERAEHERRMDQMAVNIEKMRSDMRWESRKFAASAVIAAATLVGAGIAIGNYYSRPGTAGDIAKATVVPLSAPPSLAVGSLIAVPGQRPGDPITILEVQPDHSANIVGTVPAPAPQSAAPTTPAPAKP